jgi:hypothetical protein
VDDTRKVQEEKLDVLFIVIIIVRRLRTELATPSPSSFPSSFPSTFPSTEYLHLLSGLSLASVLLSN